MAEIYVLQTGKMLVSTAVHDRDSKKGKLAYTGILQGKKGRSEVTVKAFLIKINGKNVLVDTGWSEQCAINARRHLGIALYFSSQPTLTLNDSVIRQLKNFDLTPEKLDAVILTHLDCDHASAIKDLKGAKHFYATKEELDIAQLPNPRYRKSLWEGVEIEGVQMNYDSHAPFGKSCDLFGDGSVRIVYTPGHSAGSCCVVVKDNGKMAVIAGDNGTNEKSWSELILSGPIHNIQNMKFSLRWLNKMYQNPNCVAVLTSHDKDYNETKIEF